MDIDITLRFSQREDFKGTLRTYMSPPDQVIFERTYDRSLQALGDGAGLRVEWVLWFVWRAWRREVPQAQGEFDPWTEDLLEYEMPEVDANPPVAEPTA